jgi:tetratricopeptide (TPR) repeat protein
MTAAAPPDDLRALSDALRAGRWREVERSCVARLADGVDPTGAVAAVLARARFRLGDPAGCAAAARDAARAGDGPIVRIALAEAALAAGRPGEARALLEDRVDPTALQGAGTDPDALDAAVTLVGVLVAAGEAERGYGLALRIVAALQAAPAADPERLDEAGMALGWSAWACGRIDEARASFSDVHARRVARGAAATLLAEALDGLGTTERSAGDPFAAVALHADALDRWSEALGPTSPAVAGCLHRMAHALHRTGDFAAARDAMGRSVALTAAALGEDHVDTWISRFELARYDIDCGDFADGFARMARARDTVARALGTRHPVVRAMDRYL